MSRSTTEAGVKIMLTFMERLVLVILLFQQQVILLFMQMDCLLQEQA